MSKKLLQQEVNLPKMKLSDFILAVFNLCRDKH